MLSTGLSNSKTRALIATLKSHIQSQTLDTRQLSEVMTEGFGGTDASGAWGFVSDDSAHRTNLRV